MVVEAFSYDSIYDLLRTEKFAAELQKLDGEDLSKIKKYLEGKHTLLNQEEESTHMFSSKKKAMIQAEIDNALRALKDLYEFRERKVINRAIFSVRGVTTVRDTTNMLEHEEEFYNKLLEFIPKNRNTFFKLLDPTSPDSDTSQKAIEQEKPKEKTIEKTATVELVAVEFLENVEPFVAQDLKSYGPYSAGAKNKIPEAIANLLIGQNKVQLIGETADEISETRKNILPEMQESQSTSDKASEN